MRGADIHVNIALDSIINRLKAIPEYKKLFADVFGEKEAVSSQNLAKALAAFERSLVANNSQFDQFMRGDAEALSISEKDGLEAFKKAGCPKCHNGPMLSDFKLHVLGVPDNEKLLEPDLGAQNSNAFRTPTLRNLRFTEPYMHSGKMETLEEVLQFYEDLGGNK